MHLFFCIRCCEIVFDSTGAGRVTREVQTADERNERIERSMQEVDRRKLGTQWQVCPDHIIIRFESNVKNFPTYLRNVSNTFFFWKYIQGIFLICCLKLLAWIVCSLSECFRSVFKGDRHAILEAEVDSSGPRAWGRVGGFENEVRIVSERTTEGGNCKKKCEQIEYKHFTLLLFRSLLSSDFPGLRFGYRFVYLGYI